MTELTGFFPAEVFETMPPKRRMLFRGVWGHKFQAGQANDFFATENLSPFGRQSA